MIKLSSIAQLPNVPSVYAMFGGENRRSYVAYVGMAGKLKQRVTQHLVRRDSSVATGASAVTLNPDYITEVRWWEHSDFAQRHVLEAAELVAFDILDPALRSRGAIQDKAKQLYENEEFRKQMRSLFQGEPSGCLSIPTLREALKRISALEKRLAEMEKRLERMGMRD